MSRDDDFYCAMLRALLVLSVALLGRGQILGNPEPKKDDPFADPPPFPYASGSFFAGNVPFQGAYPLTGLPSNEVTKVTKFPSFFFFLSSSPLRGPRVRQRASRARTWCWLGLCQPASLLGHADARLDGD